jgi:hypothetical protein
MTVTIDNSQIDEAYLPIYSYIPEDEGELRDFLVEQFRRISNAVNVREIGFFLNEQVLSGKQFIPGVNNNQAFRSVFRTVVDFSPLSTGTTSKPHGITINSSFSLIDLWGSGTNASALTGNPINQPNITYDATNINITSAAAYTRCYAVIEYILEL